MQASERIEIVLVGWVRDNEYEGAVAYRRHTDPPADAHENRRERGEQNIEAPTTV